MQGTTEKKAFCETCGLNAVDCAGHFGYIKLVLPVFHVGFFRHTINILQCICKVNFHTFPRIYPPNYLNSKTCARVMVDDTNRRAFLRRFRRPGLENLARQAICKQVLAQARKVNICNHCGAINGTVKKGGPLKIIHERFRQKKLSDEAEKWRNSFAAAIEGQAEVGRFLGLKGLEELNPLKVLDLFKRMPAEVHTPSLSLPHSLTSQIVGLRISWSEADSRTARRILVAIHSRTSCCDTTFSCSRWSQVGNPFHIRASFSNSLPATKMT